MGDAGFIRFPTCLDPRAEEFRPFNQVTLFQPHPHQIYYPYPQQPIADLHLTPFSDFTNTTNVAPFYAPQAHVSLPPLPPPLPPPSPAPTRTLLLSSVPTDVSESDVRRDLEIFGDVRAVQMERVRDGIVTVHFYDVRSSQRSAAEIRGQHMRQQGRLRVYYDAVLARNSSGEFGGGGEVWEPVPVAAPVGPGVVGGHAVWAQFKVPVGVGGVPDGVNQGTIVVFNLDEGVNTARLKEIFEAFGPVKELRETPMKRQQRFIEFYDVRHASRALAQMNGKEINGKEIVIEFSRPGGHIKKFANKSGQTRTLKTFHSPPRYSKPNPRPFPSPLPPPPLSFPLKIHSGGSPNVPPRCYNSQTQLKSKKVGGCKGMSNGFIVNESEGCFKSNSTNSKGSGKKNSRKGESNGSGGGTSNNTEKQVEIRKVSGSRMFLKGRQGGKGCLDTRFLINEEGVSETDCRDSRTTVMIKNIPNKYSQKLLLNMLDNHCIHCNENIADGGPLSSYDFLYLPIDFVNKCNVGYGFVNMTSPEATLRLYKAFHHQNWVVFNSKKICEVTYARLQGAEALKEHFRNSKFPGEADEYLPVVFSPPRDGSSQLTDPTPIVGRSSINAVQSPSAVSSSNSNSSREPNDGNDDLRAVEEGEEVSGGIDNNDGCHSNDGLGGVNDVGGGGGSNTTSSNGGDSGHDPYDQ
ncbi:protein terminal ear1-like [Rhododendron vialii]|uniref:protein terminal ear1-like n=1 Tax=Rhododendron vialii TaxID=182163 RepID=UPI00265DD2F4|nr:protein terminal ear1-like [Rhododendron vialii]